MVKWNGFFVLFLKWQVLCVSRDQLLFKSLKAQWAKCLYGMQKTYVLSNNSIVVVWQYFLNIDKEVLKQDWLASLSKSFKLHFLANSTFVSVNDPHPYIVCAKHFWVDQPIYGSQHHFQIIVIIWTIICLCQISLS